MTLRIARLPLALVLAAALSACQSSPPAPVATASRSYDSNEDGQRISALENALADAMIKIERLKSEQTDNQPLPDFPPDAKSDSCYAKMQVPAQYVDRSERRIVKEASERFETVPAKLEWVDEKVLVSEEYVQLKVVPATYKWLKVKTEVLPERSQQVLVTPAKYRTVTEKVIDTPEEKVWRPGRGEQERIDEETGRIVHLETVPARYRTIKKQVLASPPEYRTEVTPAVYELVSKKVVDVPEHTIEVIKPAVYKTIKVQRMVEPERQVRHVIPPVYKTFNYRERIADPRLEWREIPCKPTLTKELVRELQKALNAAGYDAGYADGIFGKRTELAILAFQKDKGMATGRLSTETLDALGVDAGSSY